MGPVLLSLNPPSPPAFLDPLYNIENSYYYAVPKYFDIKHTHNRWLIGRIKANDAEAVHRKLEISPSFIQNKYFQVIDNPSLYFEDKKAGGPMYHVKCVLYLTALGVSIYMKSREVTEMLLSYRTHNDERIVDPEEVQYASHLQNLTDGDFHAFPSFIIAVRREFYSAGLLLQAFGWKPNKQLALPVRRRYERRAFYFRDWLDVTLHLLTIKSFYPIHLLIAAVISAPTYRYSTLPLDLFKTGKLKPTPIGLIDVGDLPEGLRLTGAANLLEVTMQYDRYLQIKQTAFALKKLRQEVEADGGNFQTIFEQAQGYLPPPSVKDMSQDTKKKNSALVERTSRKTVDSFGREDRGKVTGNQNNNARSEVISSNKKPQMFCSEPLRILLFSLEKDRHCKSLQQCLDAFHVYVKQGYFFNVEPLLWGDPKARDQRNLFNCLLNMIRREQDSIDSIIQSIRSGKRRFSHVEEHKVLDNRRQQHSVNIEKIICCLAHALLQTKEIVAFLHSVQFPVYNSVDFQAVPRVRLILPSIRFGVIREFNRNQNAWKFLTADMLRMVAKDSALTLYFKVGKVPTRQDLFFYRQQLIKKKKMKLRQEREKRQS